VREGDAAQRVPRRSGQRPASVPANKLHKHAAHVRERHLRQRQCLELHREAVPADDGRRVNAAQRELPEAGKCVQRHGMPAWQVLVASLQVRRQHELEGAHAREYGVQVSKYARRIELSRWRRPPRRDCVLDRKEAVRVVAAQRRSRAVLRRDGHVEWAYREPELFPPQQQVR